MSKNQYPVVFVQQGKSEHPAYLLSKDSSKSGDDIYWTVRWCTTDTTDEVPASSITENLGKRKSTPNNLDANKRCKPLLPPEIPSFLRIITESAYSLPPIEGVESNNAYTHSQDHLKKNNVSDELNDCHLKIKDGSSLFKIHNVTKHEDIKVKDLLPTPFKKCSKEIAHFFLFCHERVLIWHRRQAGWDHPWTGDTTLMENFFCNVYRELDRGSAYFRSEILKMWEREKKKEKLVFLREVLWASICYRLINRITTFEKFGGIPTINMWPEFKKYLQKLSKEHSVIFTGAHNVIGLDRYISTMSYLFHEKKISLLARDVELMAKDRKLQTVFEFLVSLKNVGNFFAWQVVCDLLESKVLSPCTEEDWAQLGPGAINGIDLCFNGIEINTEYLELAKLLRNIQEKVYDSLGVTFSKVFGRKISLKNMEHALCEFHKYNALKRNKNATNRVWDPEHGRGSQSFMDTDKVCRFCQYGGNEDGDDIFFCDLCLNAYCNRCVDQQQEEEPFWICSSCKEIEEM